MATIASEHISKTSTICGGKPCVAGTRIRVWDIHFWHDLRGQAPQEIVAAFPSLTLADVYAALAYYLDHREEIEAEMKQADEFAKGMEQQRKPTRFSQLRDQILQDRDSRDDSLPSG